MVHLFTNLVRFKIKYLFCCILSFGPSLVFWHSTLLNSLFHSKCKKLAEGILNIGDDQNMLFHQSGSVCKNPGVLGNPIERDGHSTILHNNLLFVCGGSYLTTTIEGLLNNCLGSILALYILLHKKL